MARQRIIHGAFVDMVTPDELYRAIHRPAQETRVRAPQSLQLDANGAGKTDVYKVPTGMGFEVRRAVFVLTGNAPTDPNAGNVVLNVAGKWIAYTRSGQLIEYAQPQYGAAIQVPGSQSWGDEQGPYVRNAEVLGVQVAGLTPNAVLNIYLEGILKRPSESNQEGS